MMKKTPFFLTIVSVCAACTPMDTYEPEPVNYRVLQWENASIADLGKFQEQLEDFSRILFFIDKKLTFRITALEYETVDPNNHPVIASGVVFYPLNRTSRGVFETLPTAHIGGTGPSDNLYAIEGVMALLGYTVIVPDLLGFGSSKDLVSPFLMTENTGRVAYDMRCAAARFLWDEFRYALPAETTIMGYSLGGSAALATQKYYETHHANKVKVKAVYAGGGAYDLPAAFATFANTRFSDYPSIPNAILAFDHYYGLNLDFEQVFTGELLAHHSDWYSGSYTLEEMMERLGTNLYTYMHADFFKSFDDQNEELKKLHPFLIQNSVSEGWRPKAPIYLSHAKVDTYVPVECAKAIETKLRKAGANISLTLYPGTHNTVGYLHYLLTFLQFT